ncbi:MAG: hypothetical protein O9293_05780 [Porphyrobacter sp.]|nr:hypothetical protein [Porphyrobacter sp.]
MGHYQTPKNETPLAATGGASCNQLSGCLQDTLTLSAYRAQHLIVEHGIRPDLAAMMASLAFGGQGHG